MQRARQGASIFMHFRDDSTFFLRAVFLWCLDFCYTWLSTAALLVKLRGSTRFIEEKCSSWAIRIAMAPRSGRVDHPPLVPEGYHVGNPTPHPSLVIYSVDGTWPFRWWGLLGGLCTQMMRAFASDVHIPIRTTNLFACLLGEVIRMRGCTVFCVWFPGSGRSWVKNDPLEVFPP
jgi:hypothetical protein